MLDSLSRFHHHFLFETFITTWNRTTVMSNHMSDSFALLTGKGTL
jgi:hypothetical protein